MMHTNRVWSLTDVDPAQLAHRLKEHSFCGCVGFRCEGYLWLNDSTSADAIQEFAVVRESDGAQIESITVSWAEAEWIEEFHAALTAPDSAPPPNTYGTLLPHSLEHGDACPLCA